MSGISPEVWLRLIREQVSGETLWARRAAPDKTNRLIAALDSNHKRHLLVQLEPSETSVEDEQSRGLHVATRELEMPGRELGRYLDITCKDATGHDAFDLIGGEIAERLAAGQEPAPDIVTRVIAKWRRFWGQPPKKLLSRDMQIGLLAEVWFLNHWLIPLYGPSGAILRWRGPFGARHDFEWPGCSVEVKATSSTRGLIHRINGLDQLAPPEQGDIFLFSLQLREEAGAATTLPTALAECRDNLEDDAGALSLFDNALFHWGHSPADDNEYSKLRFHIVNQGLYVVRDDFPHLTSARLLNGLPRGIEHVEYDINLDVFTHLCIAREPGEVPLL